MALLEEAVLRRMGQLFGGHQPDIGALSASIDGQLPPDRERALLEHVTACDACRVALEELRLAAAIARSMPEADPPRSFRLRPADVTAAPRPAAGYGGLMRWAPAVSAAAVLVLAVTAVADRTTDDGSGGGSLAASREADGPVGMLSADDAAAAGSQPEFAPPGPTTTEDPLQQTAESIETAADAVAGDRAAEGAPTPSGAAAGDAPSGDGGFAASESPATGMVPAPEIQAPQDSERLPGDEDGNRTGFLVVEVVAGIVAMAAAAGYVAWRITRGGVPG